MSDKSISILLAFNRRNFSFLDSMALELSEVRPEIMLIKSKLEKFKSINARMILDYFMKFADPTYEDVCQRNEAKFLAVDSDDINGQLESKTDNEKYIKRLMFFKQLWIDGKIKAEVKDRIWQYFKEQIDRGNDFYKQKYGCDYRIYVATYGDPTVAYV